MQQYNENRLNQTHKMPDTEADIGTNTGTWLLICIILVLINIILGLL